MFHLKVKVTKPGHRAPSYCCSVTTGQHHLSLRRCIPCSRHTQQIKSTEFLLQSSAEEIVGFKWNAVFYGRFKIPLVCVLDVFVGRHSNMDKEFWKFIEFEGSGRPHQVMG